MSKVRWFVIFAMAVVVTSMTLAVYGQWLPAIYCAVITLVVLKIDELDEK